MALLYRAAGSPKVSDTAGFEDVAETAYYAGAVAWAQKHGITDGVSATRFAPTTIAPAHRSWRSSTACSRNNTDS